jgi:hypothetical protein
MTQKNWYRRFFSLPDGRTLPSNMNYLIFLYFVAFYAGVKSRAFQGLSYFFWLPRHLSVRTEKVLLSKNFLVLVCTAALSPLSSRNLQDFNPPFCNCPLPDCQVQNARLVCCRLSSLGTPLKTALLCEPPAPNMP